MIQRQLNAVIALILAVTLASAYGVQVIYDEVPCPLCMLQRIGMFGVALGALLNLRFNIKMSHYAIMLASSIFGGFVALRQISLHVCPGFETFGIPVLGLSLYTWSFVVFTCCVAAVALLLCLYNPQERLEEFPALTGLEWTAYLWIAVLAIANIATTFWQCGWGPCTD
jgi:disulfide bond formation protein DsbB